MNRKQQVVEGSEARAIERLIVDTQFKIHQLMKDEGVSKADLAKRLSCSKSSRESDVWRQAQFELSRLWRRYSSRSTMNAALVRTELMRS